MRPLLCFLMLLFVTIAPLHAAPLSEQDKEVVATAEAYLNSFSVLKARFLQISDDGAQAEGDAYLSRPGKLRLQYDPPNPLVLVADGTFLIIDDKRHDNPSYLLLSQTPAGILVRDKIKLLGGDLKVTKVTHQTGVITVSVTDSKESDQGELTLVFSEKPMQLKQWRIVDAQNQVTTVSLFDVQLGVNVDPKLFVVKRPDSLSNP